MYKKMKKRLTLRDRALYAIRGNQALWASCGVTDDEQGIRAMGAFLADQDAYISGIDTSKIPYNDEGVRVKIGMVQNLRAKRQLGYHPTASVDDASLFGTVRLNEFDPTQYMIKYAQLNLADQFSILPVRPGAKTHSYMQYDIVSQWKRVEGNDIPISDASGKEYYRAITHEANAFGYNIQEVANAAFSGVPIENLKMKAQRRGREEYKQNRILGLNVKDEDNIQHLFSDDIDEFTSAAGATGWANQNGTQILNELRASGRAISEATKGNYGIDSDLTLYVSLADYNILASKETKETYKEDTVLEYMLTEKGKKSTRIGNIEIVYNFDDANLFAAGTAGGYIIGSRDPEAVQFVNPLDMATIPPQYVDLYMKIIAYSFTGGLIFRQPKAWARYSFS